MQGILSEAICIEIYENLCFESYIEDAVGLCTLIYPNLLTISLKFISSSTVTLKTNWSVNQCNIRECLQFA